MLKKQIIINSLKINYFENDIFDKEKAVIFLHGWGSRALHLENIYKNIENYIALDLPGFGESDRPQSAWSISDYATFLKSFLEKIGIKEPVLIGHSFGGGIIVKYLSSGERAKKAILISPSGIRRRGLKIFLYRIVAKIFKLIFFLPGLSFFRNRIRKKIYRAIDSEDYIEAGKMTETYKKIIQEDLSRNMRDITVKVVLIWGEDDASAPIWQGRMTNGFIKNSSLNIIQGAGHYSFLDKPEEFRQIFLREVYVD